MHKHNAVNERIKREYFTYLKEARRQSEASVDAVAAALARFEGYTRCRDFKTFHHQQAVAFKQWLADRPNEATGKRLSKATLHGTLSHLKRFFQWLAGRPGYKSRFSYSEADYFNVSEKDTRIATARRSRPVPTVEQVRHVPEQQDRWLRGCPVAARHHDPDEAAPQGPTGERRQHGPVEQQQQNRQPQDDDAHPPPRTERR